MGTEKNLCRVIMLCQMTAILSGVAMLYLAVIIIIPSKNELNLDIDINPIMCSTIHVDNVNKMTNEDGTPAKCKWASCREWCLSKVPAMCFQIWVRPRLRGANVTLQDCDEVEQDKNCSALNVTSGIQFRCKLGECLDLTGLYNCSRPELNVCRLISPAYDCAAKNISRETILCDDEKCKKRLHGVVTCDKGECLALHDIKDYTQCERKCSSLDMENYNTVIFSQERIITKKCMTITSTNGTEEMKSLSESKRWVGMKDVLMLFCTYVVPTETGFSLDDCFNGTIGEYNVVKEMKDYSSLLKYHYEASFKKGWLLEPEERLQVVNDTRLYINTEQCVNTLQKECTQFYKDHTKDEKDGRTRDRFPCFQTKMHNEFVTAQYNPEATQLYLILASSVPATLFIFSCGCLFFCSKVVHTDDDGHLKLISFKKELLPEEASEL